MHGHTNVHTPIDDKDAYVLHAGANVRPPLTHCSTCPSFPPGGTCPLILCQGHKLLLCAKSRTLCTCVGARTLETPGCVLTWFPGGNTVNTRVHTHPPQGSGGAPTLCSHHSITLFNGLMYSFLLTASRCTCTINLLDYSRLR